ncbi:virB8 family protein [Snodgrassella alvi]|uniref:Type VI secretion protein n=1 Tax=Snodgrassella alvi TaxID=1196083 RepID=A0A2N9WUP7_9NEIS|nr:type IV secretion system protein [Snodgrassella alvi]PIT16427.1 type VI secretion protein [Snodgrassella alvi]PIT22047.1 type VI secretion protein [Snodgrassella alvi]
MSTPNNSKAALNKQGREFIQSAAAFNRSEIDMVRRNSKIAWRIAIGCLVITGMAIGAVAALTPLKTVQPYVIRVDNNTGATDIVTTLKQSEKTYGEVIDKYWLAQYIKYRESYDWQTIQSTYDATMLLSAQPVQQEFAKIYTDNNPNAPHKILKDRFKVVVNVKAISFVGQMAQIRFDKQLIPLTGNLSKTTPPQQLIATVAFDYANQPMQEKDRLVNPLGFQITSYRVDPENTP